MFHELWSACRSLLRSPGFSWVVVLTLALGIGANSAIFTVAKGVLLDPLPYPEPDRLVVIMESNPSAGYARFSASPPNWISFRDRSTAFESMAALRRKSFSLKAPGQDPERLAALQVTGRYFEVFDVAPEQGRRLGVSDDRPEAERVAMLGYELWQRRFAGGPVLDTSLELDGEPYRVVGVMPAGFQEQVDLFVPLAMVYEETQRGAHYLGIRGRLKPGVELETAATELAGIAEQLAEEFPDTNEGWTTTIEPLHGLMVESFRSVVLLLFGAVFLVLLIACANVANLFLVRLADREREMALRTALGAGRSRLIGQWMAETLVLSLCGGVLGVLLGIQGTRLLVRLAADDIPRASEIGVDPGVLAFTAGLSILTGLLLGLLPTLQRDEQGLAVMLKEGGRGQAGGRRGQKIRSGLVLAEVAVAVLLLIGAGLLLRSLERLVKVDPGFDGRGVLSARLSLPESRYPEQESQIRFFEQLYERLQAAPEFAERAAIFPMPLTGSNFLLTFYIQGTEIPQPNAFPTAHIRVVSSDYFDVMDVPLLVGRGFCAADTASAPAVVVINRSAALRFWPEEDPIGQRITFDDPNGEDEIEWLTVIGVVADVRHATLDADLEPEVYWVDLQNPMQSTTVLVRGRTGNTESLVGPLRREVAALDGALALYNVRSVESIVTESLAEPRFNGVLLSLFAGLALLLSSLGVYGVVSYAVSRSTREIGVRLALGAGTGGILALVMRRGVALVVGGIVIGLALGWGLSHLLQAMIYDISPTDSPTFLGSAGVLLLVGMVACWIPAQRAMAVDPAVVLRDE